MDVPLKPFAFPSNGQAAAEAASPAPADGQRINILLVDDQPANLLALESMLGSAEYSLVRALSGPEALRCMLKQDFALVLLDVMMTGMDGFETAALIRQRLRSTHTPIIFITAGNANDTHVNRGYSLGAVDYIYKPIVPEILKAKVQVFVDLFKKTQGLARSEEALRLELAEHKRAEEARSESEEKYRELFSRASDAIVVFDSAGQRVLDANEAALKLYGYSRKDFLRLSARDLEAEPEGGHRPARAAVRGQKTSGGRVFPAEISHGALVLRGKKMIMSLTRDISERKKAEEAERLREREAMHRQFVATVSHELHTPISAIKASAESLRIGGASAAKSRAGFMTIIENHADRLGRLVDDLLVLAELESGKVGLKPGLVALREFAAQCVAGIAPLAARQEVTIDLDIDEGLDVWVDQAHLTQILQNLLDNAIKYNKKGGSVRVEGRRTNDREAQVSIRDTGIGIQAADLPLIFHQFHRTERARALRIGGTGLGLYIIKAIVETNGGRIWAESVEDQGSVFHFTAPLAK